MVELCAINLQKLIGFRFLIRWKRTAVNLHRFLTLQEEAISPWDPSVNLRVVGSWRHATSSAQGTPGPGHPFNNTD